MIRWTTCYPRGDMKITFKRVVKVLSSQKLGTCLMVAVAAYQLLTAIDAVVDDRRVGFDSDRS